MKIVQLPIISHILAKLLRQKAIYYPGNISLFLSMSVVIQVSLHFVYSLQYIALQFSKATVQFFPDNRCFLA